MSTIQVRLLGPPVIEFNGKPIQVDTRKAIALLAYLIITRRPQPRDLLATLLWPDLDQAHARSALRRTLSSLKHSLGGEGLSIARESIGLDGSAEWMIDLYEFEKQLSKDLTHIHTFQACRERISILSSVLELVRGDFLAGFSLRDSANFDDWQILQSENLRQQLALLLEKLTDCYTFLGEYEQAILIAKRSQVIEPLNEKTARDLMRLYTWSGRRDASLQQYHDLTRTLKDELQISPSSESTQLYTEILENSLIPPHGPDMQNDLHSKREYSFLTSPYPFVGRSEELNQLIEFYQNSATLRAFAIIEGEIGVGKTRLAEEFLSYARQNGSVVIGSRFFPEDLNLPYGPFIEGIHSIINSSNLSEFFASLPALWKVEINRLFPEVVEHDPGDQKNLGAASAPYQARLFEALDRLFQWISQGPQVGILSLDDLQWADQASVDLLTYLLQKTSGKPLFVLGTWRSEDIRPGYRLRNLLVDAQRSGKGKLIGLERFNQDEVTEFLHLLPGNPYPQPIVERLFLESEGLPYFLTEYLSAVKSREGQVSSAEFPMPSSIRDLLDSRLARISLSAKNLLSVASAIGRSFEFDLLCSVSRQEEETCINSLEELLGYGLVKGSAGHRAEEVISYDFIHDKLRSLVYEEISRPRRRVIHKQIASTLIQSATALNQPSIAGQIAFHYRRAGELSLASQYYFQAGDYARSIFAIPDALNNYQTCLLLGYPDRAVLREAIGDLQTLSGSYDQALESYRACLVETPPNQTSLILYKMAQVNHRLGNWSSAEIQYDQALKQLTESSDLVLRINILVDWSLTSLYKDGLSSAVNLARQALSLAKRAQDCRSLSQVYNILGILERRKGHTEIALNHLKSSLELAERIGDRPGSIAALNNLAQTYGEQGELSRAILLAQKALEICALIGDRHREAALLSNLADLFYSAGEAETAMIHLKKSVAIFSEIGVSAGDIQPEIWKMTEW